MQDLGRDCLLSLCRVKCARRQGLQKHTGAEAGKVKTTPCISSNGHVCACTCSETAPRVQLTPKEPQIHRRAGAGHTL